MLGFSGPDSAVAMIARAEHEAAKKAANTWGGGESALPIADFNAWWNATDSDEGDEA